MHEQKTYELRIHYELTQNDEHQKKEVFMPLFR